MKATHFKKILCILLSLLLLLATVSCGSNDQAESMVDGAGGNPGEQIQDVAGNAALKGEDFSYTGSPDEGEKQPALNENPFVSVAASPVSTFSADVDTASYSLLRKLINNGYSLSDLRDFATGTPFRSEELINYFDYAYARPTEGEVFGHSATLAKSPWNDNTYLMILGLTTEAIREKGENNLVFLIDVSGSMAADDKLPLLKNAFSCLLSALDENDSVSIVTYSGKEAVVLEGCPGNRDETVLHAIRSLTASGSTNGQSGLQKAYALAEQYYKPNGNNRIIMASDGDLNVGISSPEELKNYISEKRDTGIYLSVLGFGTGNYKNETMSALAQNGNGVYYYIDSAREAEKVLGTDLLATLYTVAKDVKFQLTFDAGYVSEYRLIGYENRLLANEDFNDDQKDAGDVGAGHSVTVCYELKLTDAALSDAGRSAFWLTLAMRYKLPTATDSTLREIGLNGSILTDAPSADFTFAACLIETAMILNGSRYNAKQINAETVFGTLCALDLSQDAEKNEFKTLIEALIP